MTGSIGTSNKLFRLSFFLTHFDINNIINKSVNLIKLNISINHSVWLHFLYTLVVIRNLDLNNNEAFPF